MRQSSLSLKICCQLSKQTRPPLDSLNKLQDTGISIASEMQKRVSEIDVEFGTCKQNFHQWEDEKKADADSAFKGWHDRIKELEALYTEKLRIEAPAQYWNDFQADYHKKGRLWRSWALAASSVFILYLTVILFSLPNDYLVGMNLKSLKITLILGLVASIGVYMIRLFVRLSISSFHLARDAKERYQLTLVYLALLKEKAVSEEDRDIILQSLFARADTGLLKGDSTPALPDGALSHIIRNMKGT